MESQDKPQLDSKKLWISWDASLRLAR